MGRWDMWEDELGVGRAEVVQAAQHLRAMVDRVAGTGDGSSWLDQLAQRGALSSGHPWSSEERRAAADLLGVAARVLRTTRGATGGYGTGKDQLTCSGASSDLLLDRLPMNRKERYFTGTVLPMLVASDEFAHLPRFLRLCGLDQITVDLVGPDELAAVQFFTEYSFAESVITPQDEARFGDRPTEADTPDVVLVGPDWLLAVEAKMFHRPTRQALTAQMERQRVLVDYWTRVLGLDPERVAHVLLLPEGLAADRRDLPVPVVTWEQVLHDYRLVGPTYWVHVLRAALEQYPVLASPKHSFGQNADGKLTGEQITADFLNGDLEYTWMGRGGGFGGKKLHGDLTSGAWCSQRYEVRREPLPGNPNWFPVEDFVARVRARDRFTVEASELIIQPPPAPEPPSEQPSGISLHAADGRYLDATLEEDGAVVLRGQILYSPGEYEYAFRIEPEDVPRLRAALGGREDEAILDLLAGHRDAFRPTGEGEWLKEHRVPAVFWSRSDF